jgi:hypothetical protein
MAGPSGGWGEIARTMNTQKAVTALAQNNHEEVIMVRRCSGPNQPVRKLYDALKFKYAPFVKTKIRSTQIRSRKIPIHQTAGTPFGLTTSWIKSASIL